MGRWFVRFLAAQGFDVEVADPSGAPEGVVVHADWRASALDQDLIVVAAPLRRSNEILLELAQRQPKGMVFDIGSLKTPLTEGLKACAAAGLRICSVHPMFGPDTELLSDRHVIFMPVGAPEVVKEARTLFAETMVQAVEMPLAEHDHLIAYVLGLSHALNIAFFTALANFRRSGTETGADVEHHLRPPAEDRQRRRQRKSAPVLRNPEPERLARRSARGAQAGGRRADALHRRGRRDRFCRDDGARARLSECARAGGALIAFLWERIYSAIKRQHNSQPFRAQRRRAYDLFAWIPESSKPLAHLDQQLVGIAQGQRRVEQFAEIAAVVLQLDESAAPVDHVEIRLRREFPAVADLQAQIVDGEILDDIGARLQVAARADALRPSVLRSQRQPLQLDAHLVTRRRKPVEVHLGGQLLALETREQGVLLPDQPVVAVGEGQAAVGSQGVAGEESQFCARLARVPVQAFLVDAAGQFELPATDAPRLVLGVVLVARRQPHQAIAARNQIVVTR
ncbi:MAG: prephenate dehydrogenase [Rhodanobacteraceae bacterium]|nr:prephenate dehydrogenase [Rhodanobacteraceae bacterium]